MKCLIFITNIIFFVSAFGQDSYSNRAIECQKLGYFESQDCIVGSKFPSFEVVTFEGDTLSGNKLNGKIRVLNF